MTVAKSIRRLEESNLFVPISPSVGMFAQTGGKQNNNIFPFFVGRVHKSRHYDKGYLVMGLEMGLLLWLRSLGPGGKQGGFC